MRVGKVVSGCLLAVCICSAMFWSACSGDSGGGAPVKQDSGPPVDATDGDSPAATASLLLQWTIERQGCPPGETLLYELSGPSYSSGKVACDLWQYEIGPLVPGEYSIHLELAQVGTNLTGSITSPKTPLHVDFGGCALEPWNCASAAVGCNTDGTCGKDDDCTCVDCTQDLYCSSLWSCTNDGQCRAYYEGCQCADCAGSDYCKPTCKAGDTVACYSGAPGSAGLGTCSAGTSTCSPSGSWELCAGEVLPKPQDCATPADDACNGSADPCVAPPSFGKVFSGAGKQFGFAVSSTPSGNMIISGQTTAAVDFGAGPLGPSGTFLVALGPSGAVLWQKLFAGSPFIRSLATDDAGNVFAYGGFGGSVDFGGGPLAAGSTDALFLAKFSADGQHVFSKKLDVSLGSFLDWRAATTPSGDVVITGAFEGSADLGGGALSSAGGYDVFVAKFDGAGNHLWSKSFGSFPSQHGEGVAVTKSGNVILAGRFRGSIDFGGGALTAVGSDAFLVDLDSSGAHVWSKSFGGDGDQAFGGVGVDDVGEIAVVGAADTTTVDIGAGPTQAKANDSICFAARFDATGAALWSQAFACTFNPYLPLGPGVRMSPTGDLYVAGTFGYGSPFVFAVDSAGAPKWSHTFATAYADAIDLALDPTGNVLVTGSAQVAIDFGAGPLTVQGNSGAYLVKLAQ